jgi:hypothetical protein
MARASVGAPLSERVVECAKVGSIIGRRNEIAESFEKEATEGR